MSAIAEQGSAALFSAPMFRPVLNGSPTGRVDALVKNLRSELDPAARTKGEVIDSAYQELSRNRRSEYLYKNLIASNIFVGRHRASNAALLNEFRVGDAVADCVLVNGHATVYEVKTELDNPGKLNRQIAEYYRAFSLVNVVVHVSEIDKYVRLISDTPVGLIAVGQRRQLSRVRSAREHHAGLETRAMFNALREAEVRVALEDCGIDLPEVPNGIRYARYLELAETVSPELFSTAFASALKARGVRNARGLVREPAFSALRALLVQLDPTELQEQRLRTWLSKEV